MQGWRRGKVGLLIPVSLLGTSVPLNVVPVTSPVPAQNFTTCWQLCYFPLGIQGHLITSRETVHCLGSFFSSCKFSIRLGTLKEKFLGAILLVSHGKGFNY